jgi:uncharacterized protein
MQSQEQNVMPGTHLKSRSWTMIGLAVALIGLPAIVFSYRMIVGETTAASQLIARELVVFALLGFLIWIIRSREQLSLESIGLKTAAFGKSLLWGLVGFLLCGIGVAVSLLILGVLGLKMGGGSEGFATPTYVFTLIVIRAGIVEEVFYRGYAIERLTALTHSKAVAVVLPLLLFSLFHYRQGMGGIILAFILGGVLSGFYLWKRDLTANMFAHFLVDFVPNILIPMLSGEQAS